MIKVLHARPEASALTPAAARTRIVDFMRGASIEATRPSDAEVAQLGAILPKGTEVYLTALPGRDPAEQVEIGRAHV